MNGKQVFIASSSEKRRLAGVIASALEELGLSVLPWWDTRAFRAGDVTLTRLIQLAHLCEASVLVFGGEDEIWFRPKSSNSKAPQLAARDNVMLEYGMFVSHVGLERAVIVAREGIKLPTDVHGVTVIFFKAREPAETIARRVRSHFEQLLSSRISRAKLSDSGLVIRTDWSLDMHKLQSNGLANWNSIRLYEGREGAQAWGKVETDPAYADRVQNNINGFQIAQLIGNREISTIVSMGPGLGTVDAELIANLRNQRLREYVPVDVNHFFLMRSAETVAAKNPWVECKSAIQCDFDNDASFVGTVISDHCPGPRLFLMAGGTFGNSQRTVHSLLGTLYQIMDSGDTFTFDLFCHGPNYDPDKDPMKDTTQWSDAVLKFFANGVRYLHGDKSLSDDDARKQIEVVNTVGNSGLSKTTTISVLERRTKVNLVNIRRFDLAEITAAIDHAGFSRAESKNVSIGKQLERHVLLALK